MRVLWYAAVQLPAVTGASSAGGGWVEGLRTAIERFQPDVELGVASPGAVEHEPFTAGNTTYFHVPSRRVRGRVERASARWRIDVTAGDAVASCAETARVFVPDVVHVHGSEHFYGLAIPLVVAPAVVSIQGIATVYARFAFSGVDPAAVLAGVPTRRFALGEGLVHDARWLRARGARERSVIASCDDFMGRTEWDRAVLKLLRPQARYHEVGEVLGEPFYAARWSQPPAAEETLYCTGGASALKGVETLLEALILLRRSGLRRPRLRLAGAVTDGPLGRKIGRLLGEPELRGAVDVLGRIGPQEIAAELAKANAFVLPSHMDNSPNALCEAMLVGAPCIAAFVGGVPSLVRDGVDGLLYHDADPYALAGKIDRLLSDPALAARLGAGARETALLRHDPRRVAEQAVGTYREVIDRRHGRQAANEPRGGGHATEAKG